MTYTLAYYSKGFIAVVKSFMIQLPEPSPIKRLFDVIYAHVGVNLGNMYSVYSYISVNYNKKF